VAAIPVAGVVEGLHAEGRVAVARLLDRLARDLVDDEALRGELDGGEEGGPLAGEAHRRRLPERRHLEPVLSAEDVAPVLPRAEPGAHGRRVVGEDAADVEAAIAVEVLHEERDGPLARDELHGAAEHVAVERPHGDRPSHDGEQLGALVAEDVRDGKAVAGRGEASDAVPPRNLERPRRRLAHEDDLGGGAGVDEIHEAVAVEVVRHDPADLVGDGNVLPAEAPVLGELVRAQRDRDLVVGRRARPLVVQLDPAGPVVGDDEIPEPVAVHVGARQRSRETPDLDDLETIEAEVLGEILEAAVGGRGQEADEQESGEQSERTRGHGTLLVRAAGSRPR
jgi:hypothetical protein